MSGPDLAPQKFLLSQKFRHLMNKSEDRGGMKLPYDYLFTFVTINQWLRKKSESLQTEGRHFRSMICKINDV